MLVAAWISNATAWWLGASSIVMFVGTAFAAPWLVCRMPADYFSREEHPLREWSWALLARRIVLNVIGAALIIAGVVMLVVPGQGVLTILIGVACLSFRGKRKLMRWLVTRRGVLKGLNWIRHRRGYPPFTIDPHPLRLGHDAASADGQR
jgi:hypothetical protein